VWKKVSKGVMEERYESGMKNTKNNTKELTVQEKKNQGANLGTSTVFNGTWIVLS